MYSIQKRDLYLVFSLLGIAYLLGMLLPDLMDHDTTQYALISMQMVQDTGLFLTPKYRLIEYLDKPPLQFWVSAPSMMLFGINHFAYRLPSVLTTVLGTYCTYRFGKLLYNKNIGILAAILLAGNQAYILINHDVRTDTILANLMALIAWQLLAYFKTKKTLHFIWAFIGIGFAMLQKGPIGLVVPIMAFGPHLVLNKEWKTILDWRYLVGLVIIAIILLPMTYGLYIQHGIEGVKFYYWTQSFGRITGENEWKDDSDKLFFVHSFLWSFIPWMFIATYAYFKRIGQFFKYKFKFNRELITFSGFTLVMIAMSMSQYKLPHYIYVSWVFIAVLTAAEIDRALRKNKQVIGVFIKVQYFTNALLWVVILIILGYVFPMDNILLWGVLLLAMAATVYFSIKSKSKFQAFIYPTIITFVAINIGLNGYFYPKLSTYQSGSSLAYYLKDKAIDVDKVYGFGEIQNSLEFYSEQIFVLKTAQEVKAEKESIYLFFSAYHKKEFDALGIPYETVETFPDFHITTLSPEFLNPKTRDSAVEQYYFIKTNP